MSWRYRQRSGAISRVDDQGGEVIVGVGYSGHGDGLNEPLMQHVRSVGPIPRGRWSIGAPYDSDSVGPFALPLKPAPETETFGRSAFLLHGDNFHRNKSASSGCIVADRKLRELIWESSDTDLEVVA